MQSNKRQKILTYVLAIVLIIAGFYYYNLYSNDSVVDVISTDYTAPVGEDILLLVQKMDTVMIDESVFSSPLFKNLVDSTISVNQEEKSRPNPFAPIGSNSVSGSQLSTNPVTGNR